MSLENGQLRALVKLSQGRPLKAADADHVNGILAALGARSQAHAVSLAYERGILAAPGTRNWSFTVIAAQSAVGRPAILRLFVQGLETEPVPPPAAAGLIAKAARSALEHARHGDDYGYVEDLNRVLGWCDTAAVATGVAG